MVSKQILEKSNKIAWSIGYIEYLYRNNRNLWLEILQEFGQINGLSTDEIMILVDVFDTLAINISRARPFNMNEDVIKGRTYEQLVKITYMNLNQFHYAFGIEGMPRFQS